MEKKKLFSFWIHKELYDYLKIISENEYTTISGYLTSLIKKDKNEKVEEYKNILNI